MEPRSWSGRVRKISPAPRTVRPIAGRYIDYTIPGRKQSIELTRSVFSARQTEFTHVIQTGSGPTYPIYWVPVGEGGSSAKGKRPGCEADP